MLIGPYLVDDRFITALRSHVLDCCKDVDISRFRSRRKAQSFIEHTAKQAIVDFWAEAFTWRKYKISRDWPAAVAIILETGKGPYVIVDLWIGHDYTDDDIPEPIAFYAKGKLKE
jgi:hypothetical protein